MGRGDDGRPLGACQQRFGLWPGLFEIVQHQKPCTAEVGTVWGNIEASMNPRQYGKRIAKGC
jgi:hypothetical protein